MSSFRLFPVLYVGAFGACALVTACTTDDADTPAPSRGVEATSFAVAAPEVPASSIPTPQQLTALYNTALDYDVRLSDRVKLIQGVSEADPRIAQSFVQEAMAVQFTAVTDLGDGSVGATGSPILEGQVQDPGTSPIPFITEDGTWKIARSWACSVTGAC